MIYSHQQNARDYIIEKLQQDEQVIALLFVGSIQHDFNDENSDIDIIIVVTDEAYAKRLAENNVHYYESAEQFYNGGYFDGHYFNLEYFKIASERANEPTKFYLHDAEVAFDKSNSIQPYIDKIATYDTTEIHEKTMRFLSQLEGWNWYYYEALRKNNKYLMDLAITKIILFSARLILLDNKMLFPYHKWLLKYLEKAPNKPDGMLQSIENLLSNKAQKDVEELVGMIKSYKVWTNESFNWCNYYINDIETIWMRQEEFIENI
jgi:predicted nucleotidyltransferase